jgi:biopolymer transport protein ExbB
MITITSIKAKAIKAKAITTIITHMVLLGSLTLHSTAFATDITTATGTITGNSTATAQAVTTKLLAETKQANTGQDAQIQQREATFRLTEDQIRQQRAELLKRQARLQHHTDKLSHRFTRNEEKLAKLETRLHLETGSLGELFGVVRQSAKQLNSEIQFSVTSIDKNRYNEVVTQIVAAKTLPSMSQLTGLWRALLQQINASGQIAEVTVPVINGTGKTELKAALRIGSLGLIGEQGYLAWNSKNNTATAYLKQPKNGPVAADLRSTNSTNNSINLILDPSRGMMLAQLENTPELKDRLENGGTVGYVILTLLFIGLVIAAIQGVKLAKARSQIKQQLRHPTQIGNNPLGRILQVYVDSQAKHAANKQRISTEALELRLMEVIVDEQQGLGKGLSMLKLLAALAPMLGLLGTVTGMIETFQVITQFGNGDPKVMAGGISMALITTVLGLVAAMPLLLAHNILTTQADNIHEILEKQSIGLVAEQAEQVAAG